MQLTNKHLIYCKKLAPKATNTDNLPHIIWGHGWAQDHTSLLPLASSLQNIAHHWLLDLPGFGSSSQPQQVWGSQDYANFASEWIKLNIPANATKIWVGHSFGCRVGITLASINPDLLNGLFLIAAAGIPRPIHLVEKIIRLGKIISFKSLKKLITLFNNEQYLNWLKTKFGSHDYRNADPNMRAILVKTINENLANNAEKISCPTELLYGKNDSETPVIIGHTLQKLIKNSKLHVIPQKDHYTVLKDDIHQIIYLLKKFIINIQNNQTKIIQN